jgi:hypothetical protein
MKRWNSIKHWLFPVATFVGWVVISSYTLVQLSRLAPFQAPSKGGTGTERRQQNPNT